ncbi:MAG TPA: hypothetical protein VLT47_13555 [Anaeromyxobacteraceae bacterium]|nr:hypothetical protein [Anaeromyxobacteraceae bacterium]
MDEQSRDVDTASPVAPRPPSSFQSFVRGVIAGVVIVNAATLLGAPVRDTAVGFMAGVVLAGVAALAFAFQRRWAVVAGLVVAAVLSPLLAYPACAIGGFSGFSG